MEAVPPPFVTPYPRRAADVSEFDAHLSAFRNSNRTFLGWIVLSACLRGATNMEDSLVSLSLLAGGLFGSMALAVWGVLGYVKATGKRPGWLVFGAVLSPIVPLLFLVGLLLVQKDLIKRLEAYGLPYKWLHFSAKEIEAVRASLTTPAVSTA